jgi:hypothetical protein
MVILYAIKKKALLKKQYILRRKKRMELENILSKVQEDLDKRGIKVSGDSLMEMILKFVAEKEEELIKVIKREKSDEILKHWLETPVEVEETDALREHDLVF